MKTSSAILIVSVIIAVTTGLQYERMDRLESRLRATEHALETLDPIRNVLDGLQPRSPDFPNAYQATQATGIPDVPPDREDHPNAWCPASEDGTQEWLQLNYANPIAARAIEIHANLNPGAVASASKIETDGTETVLAVRPGGWTNQGRTTTVPLSSALSIQVLRLTLDTSLAPGWNEIDAVALLDSQGNRHWAIRAEASSAWNSPPLLRSVPLSP